MSSELLTSQPGTGGSRNGHATLDPSPGKRPRARRAHGPINKWWIRTHRWTSLALGLLFLVEAVTGAVLLYGNDIARVLHPQRYAWTPSATPITPVAALELVKAAHPEINPTGVQRFEDIYLVRGEGNGRDQTDAFVDPGSGHINGLGPELPRPILFLINIHDCALTCEGLPGYQAWMTTPLPSFFGKGATIGGYLLGLLGALTIFLAISGAVVWWPGLRGLIAGFVVRRGRGPYARDLDLHRLVGIVAVPFLLMWGITGAAFYYQWPAQVYSGLLPGAVRDVREAPKPGTGPLLTLEQARAQVLAAHPGAEFDAFTLDEPTEPGGTYSFRLHQGFDPYHYWNYAGSITVRVDSHGGGMQDYAPNRPEDPAAQNLWETGFYNGLHFGTVVSPIPRLIWLTFGLTPVLLGVTGVTVWLTKSRSARNRKRRRRAA